MHRAGLVCAVVLNSFLGAWCPMAFSQTVSSVPSAATLESGDFLWPKLRNKIVPYNSEPGAATEAERKQWESERRVELVRLEKLTTLTVEERERYALLSNLGYQEFLSFYLVGEPVGTVIPFGSIGPVATGHVAIVEVRAGTPWIIEAMLHDGVREITYEKWLAGRPDEIVWHGRLKDASPEERAKIAVVAREQLKVPYNFWNFGLLDQSGFYCSKLAWFSVWKATGRSLDDNQSPNRSLWYSPKQMLSSKHILVLSSPGKY